MVIPLVGCVLDSSAKDTADHTWHNWSHKRSIKMKHEAMSSVLRQRYL